MRQHRPLRNLALLQGGSSAGGDEEEEDDSGLLEGPVDVGSARCAARRPI